jgi:hypothetical protein
MKFADTKVVIRGDNTLAQRKKRTKGQTMITPASTRHDPSFRQDKLSHGETRKYRKMLLKME